MLVSQYYHYLFRSERGNDYVVNLVKSDLQFKDYNDIGANLPEFISYVYDRKEHPRFSWSEFVDQWVAQKCIVHAKYEDLRVNPVEEIKRIVFLLSGIKIE